MVQQQSPERLRVVGIIAKLVPVKSRHSLGVRQKHREVWSLQEMREAMVGKAGGYLTRNNNNICYRMTEDVCKGYLF